jgi:calcineurin-like phosphoesterase family protein
MARDIWVSSDFHFNHDNILKFTDSTTGKLIRGEKFSSTREMDQYMLEQHNSLVKPGDIFYTLGDVMFGDPDYFQKLWPKLHGSKRLIVGNHDNIKYLSSGGFFSKVQMWRMFPEFGLLLTHVPVHPSNLRVFAAEGEYQEGDVGTVQKQFLNVVGHIHHNPAPEGPYRCVCMEQTDYKPVHIEELRIR